MIFNVLRLDQPSRLDKRGAKLPTFPQISEKNSRRGAAGKIRGAARGENAKS